MSYRSDRGRCFNEANFWCWNKGTWRWRGQIVSENGSVKASRKPTYKEISNGWTSWSSSSYTNSIVFFFNCNLILLFIDQGHQKHPETRFSTQSFLSPILCVYLYKSVWDLPFKIYSEWQFGKAFTSILIMFRDFIRRWLSGCCQRQCFKTFFFV